MPPPDARNVCTIVGCDTQQIARGLCMRHYQQWRRTGNPVAYVVERPEAPPDHVRFDSYWTEDPETGCHIWHGTVTPDGYPNFRPKGQNYQVAYRYAFTRTTGVELNQRDRVVHTCGNVMCVRPGHLGYMPSARAAV